MACSIGMVNLKNIHMRNIMLSALLFVISNNTLAQKCDTLKIDGMPNPYGCPEKALNIYKGIFKTVSEAIFEPLNKANINYCNNCRLQDWSKYNYDNIWSNNPFRFSDELEYDWRSIPTNVPCSEEQEPALFLGNVKTGLLIGLYANLPSIYYDGINALNNIYQSKADSLTEIYKKKGLNFVDMNQPLFKQYGAAALLLADEGNFHKMQSSFSITFEYNRTSIENTTSKSDILKQTPFKLAPKYVVPYVGTDNLIDVSNFQDNEDMKQYNDYTKKPDINNKLGKQYQTSVQLGQNIDDQKTEALRTKADYSVYNFVVNIQGISFEKNHEVLNAIDWNKLYTFINIKKL
jgi:hypothetical protein